MIEIDAYSRPATRLEGRPGEGFQFLRAILGWLQALLEAATLGPAIVGGLDSSRIKDEKDEKQQEEFHGDCKGSVSGV